MESRENFEPDVPVDYVVICLGILHVSDSSPIDLWSQSVYFQSDVPVDRAVIC